MHSGLRLRRPRKVSSLCATSSPTSPASGSAMPRRPRLGSGSTAVLFEEPAVASIDLRGGGPGTRETALLEPAQTVERIDAIALSGGSAFGLDAASGVQAWLKEQGRGFAVRTARVPIVPAAILFDLLAAATRTGAGSRPIASSAMRRLRAAAATSRSAASAPAPARRPSTAKAASARPRRKTPDGFTVGALAAVNAAGSVLVDRGPWFWAAPFEAERRVRRPRFPAAPSGRVARRHQGRPRANTTLVVVATDAILTKAQAKRLAVMAQSGLRARSILCIPRSTAMSCSRLRPGGGRCPMPLSV